MTDLWEEATRDHEAEQLARRVTSARLALSSLTEFLTTAASKEEHTDRMALSADSIERAVAMATADDPGSFPIVHEAVSIELEQDFDAAFAVRQAEAQRRNAPRAARRQQARQAGWDPASTSDPHNPYAPIRSYTYTGPIESDADRGAATGIRCTVEGCSWSASSTDAHERFGGKGGDPMVNAWIEHAKSEMNSKYASRAARRSEQRVANAVEKDLADGFRSKIDPELAAKIPDDVGAQLWNRLVLEPLPSHLYDTGVSEAEMYRRRARELATNYLIPIAQGYASRRTATQYATVDLGPLGVHQIEGPWDVSYDSHYLQWSVYGLMDGLVTSLFSAPSRDEVDAWVAAHPMVNPDAGEQGTLARRKVTAGHGDPGFCQVCGQAIRPGYRPGHFVHYDSMMELAHPAEANEATLTWYRENAPEHLAGKMAATDRCGDVHPVHIGNQTPMDVICHREKGHEGAHRGVTLDSDDNAITITWSPSTTARRSVAALDEIDQAILEHAQSETGTIKPGDRIGNATVTEVGTHTIQLDYGDGWSGSRQIPFVGPQGEMYPSHQRALTSVRTASEGESCPQCGTSPAYQVSHSDPWDEHRVCPTCGYCYTHAAYDRPYLDDRQGGLRGTGRTAAPSSSRRGQVDIEGGFVEVYVNVPSLPGLTVAGASIGYSNNVRDAVKSLLGESYPMALITVQVFPSSLVGNVPVADLSGAIAKALGQIQSSAALRRRVASLCGPCQSGDHGSCVSLSGGACSCVDMEHDAEADRVITDSSGERICPQCYNSLPPGEHSTCPDCGLHFSSLRRRMASLPKAPNIVVQSSVGWLATTDQMGAAVGYLSREWGDHGYRIKQDDREGVFECRASDGSVFFITSDRWGNTGDLATTASLKIAAVCDACKGSGVFGDALCYRCGGDGVDPDPDSMIDTPAEQREARRRTAGENPFPPGDKPAGEDTKPEEQKPEAETSGGDDPAQMRAGQQVTITYTLTGGQTGSGDVEGTFESFDGTTAMFTYEKGTFGVTNQNGTWVDAAGTTFSFAGAPAPEEQPQEQAPEGEVPVDTTKKPVQSRRRVASIPAGTFALAAPSGEMFTSSIPFTSPSEAATWAYESNLNWEALGIDRLDIVDSEGVKVTSVDVKDWSDLGTFASRRRQFEARSRRPFVREAVDYVTGPEWGVSYQQPAAPGEPYSRTRLNVHKLVDEPNEWGGMGVSVRHPEFDGLIFDSHDEARQFAIDRGLLVPFKGTTAALDLGVSSISEEKGRPASTRVIMDQIGSMTLMSLGAREYVDLNDGLMFRVGAGSPLRKAIIKLNVRDYYDVEIGRMNRSTLDWIVEYQQRDVDAMALGNVLRSALGQVTEGRRVVAADPDNPYGVGDSNPYVVNERTPETNPLPPERPLGTPDDMLDGPLTAQPQTTKPRKRPSGAPANGSSNDQPMGVGSAAASRRA